MIHRHGHHPWGYGHHLWGYGHPWHHGPHWQYGYAWGPGTLLSTLNTALWVALFIVLAWALLRLISPYVLPMIAGIFGIEPADRSALEILRRRYATGEIDAVTFERMQERLGASYSKKGIPHDDHGYLYEAWIGDGDTFSSPVARAQERAMMLEQVQYISETER